jgi:hypothetical protein
VAKLACVGLVQLFYYHRLTSALQYYALPNTLVYIAIYWCLGRLYCNSFVRAVLPLVSDHCLIRQQLAALNTRHVLKRSTSDKINYSVEDWRSQASGGRTLNQSIDPFPAVRQCSRLAWLRLLMHVHRGGLLLSCPYRSRRRGTSQER